MASEFNNDDTFNVIEDHIQQTLAADTKFASGGSLEINLFEEEHREDVATYTETQLPAISIEVNISGTPTDPTADQAEYAYLASIIITVGGGEVAQLRERSKYFGARAVRILQQQHDPDEQLKNLPADLDGGEIGAVIVLVQSVEVFVGEVGNNTNVLRGQVLIFAVVSVTFNIPRD